MSADSTPTDCRSDEGITTGLIDAIMTLARVLRERSRSIPLTEAVQDALKDLRGDEDVLWAVEDFEAAELAWGLIANVDGGDWTKQTQEWLAAATRWRDKFAARAPSSDIVAVDACGHVEEG